jgi:hypothetical protein
VCIATVAVAQLERLVVARLGAVTNGPTHTVTNPETFQTTKRAAWVRTQNSIIGSYAGVTESRRGCDGFHFVYVCGIYQNGRQFLVGRNHHTVLGTNAQRRAPVGNGVQSVFNLQQFPRPTERRQRKGIRRITHSFFLYDVYGCMDEEQNYQRMQKEEKNWNRLFTTILICFVTPRNERDPRVVKKDGGRAPPRDAAVIFFFEEIPYPGDA